MLMIAPWPDCASRGAIASRVSAVVLSASRRSTTSAVWLGEAARLPRCRLRPFEAATAA
ncbi:hypothetical protein [Xanthomonas sp. SS]|uniref:hypothetical protein n=1 Tax=Xanthomonas sp. SS TaxID=2724122 RepID=UPI00163ABB22|nr:hypothetical protein [Xanthomonas sp. SS]